jgi:hypothetical protein
LVLLQRQVSSVKSVKSYFFSAVSSICVFDFEHHRQRESPYKCKCNALVYSAMNFGINNQALVDLDSYLNIGDHVYRTTVRPWKGNGKYRSIFLSFNEIPNLLLRSVRLLTSLHFMQFSLIIIKKDTFFFFYF